MIANDTVIGKKATFSALDFLCMMMHEGFVGTIPLDLLKKFPGHWFSKTRLFTYMVVAGCYLFFFITSYIEGLNATFISLDKNAGNCNSVGKPLSGTYLASSSGEWEGSSAFKYTEAMYEFTFNNLQVDDQEFADLISVDFALNEVALFTSQNDVATNLLVWMHYRTSINTANQNIQEMKLLAEPSGVFRRSDAAAGIYAGDQITGNGSLSCVSQFTSFDTNSATLSFTMPYAGDCAVFASIFSNVIQTDGAVIRSDWRLNQFSIAAAINKNITRVNKLEKLYLATFIAVQGRNLEVNAMYDPAFKNSDVFYCVELEEISTLNALQDMCLVDAGGLLLLPILAHADEHCASCSQNASAAYIPCDYMSVLPFYLFLPEHIGNYGAQTVSFIEILGNTTITELKIAASRLFRTGDSVYFDELCPKCAFMWSYMGDDNPTISPYHRVLETGLHCVDSVSSLAFAALAANPPTVLVENYYVCRSTTYNNIVNAVGLSFGNTSIFAVCFLAFFLPGLYYLTKTVEEHKENIYKKLSARWEVSADLSTVDSGTDVETGKAIPGITDTDSATSQQTPQTQRGWDLEPKDLEPGCADSPSTPGRW